MDIHTGQKFSSTKCLRRIGNGRTKSATATYGTKTDQEPVMIQIKGTKSSWLGHTLRRYDSIAKQALQWKQWWCDDGCDLTGALRLIE